MSNLILPGDPPPDALKQEIVQLRQALMIQRSRTDEAVKVLIELVEQHGAENKLILGAPRVPVGKYSLTIRPHGIDGAEVILEEVEKTPEESCEGDGQKLVE